MKVPIRSDIIDGRSVFRERKVPPPEDRVGQCVVGSRFGRLVVLAVFRDGTPHMKCRCRCDCGATSVHRRSQLLGNVCWSCGCLVRDVHMKHGHSAYHRETREYRTWKSMIGRCNQRSNKRYADYGGRGIRVCRRWMNFSLFLEDMGKCPPGMSIDRKDNDGDYYPENCVWATAKQQARHNRHNHIVEAFGVRKPLCEWEDEWSLIAGLRPRSLGNRLLLGWSPERALHELRRVYEKRG